MTTTVFREGSSTRVEVTGNQGPSGTLEVGTVTTGAAGTPVIITNSGTPEAAVLDITIPRGVNGAAATIAVRNVVTGAPGSPLTITNAGTSTAALLDFSIPSGEQGAAGRGALMGTLLGPQLRANLKSALDASGFTYAIYDVSDMSTLFQDLAGTVPVTAVGQTVKSMKNAANSALHMTGALNSGTFPTLARDETGRYYLDAVAGSRLNSSYTLVFGDTVYLGAALTHRVIGNSANLFGISGSSSVLAIRDGTSIGRVGTIVQYPSRGGISLATRACAAPLNKPVVCDLQSLPGSITSWENGSGTSRPETWATAGDAGKRFMSSTTVAGDSITGSVGLTCAAQFTGSGASTRFYGGVCVLGQIATQTRVLANQWLSFVSGNDVVNVPSYDVVLFLGQSNMLGGKGDETTSTVVPAGQGASWNNSGFLTQLADPVQHLEGQYAISGSCLPAFGKQWYARTGNPILAIGLAASGSAIRVPSAVWGGWGPTGGLVEKAVRYANEAIRYLNATGIPIRQIFAVWNDGEQDASLLATGNPTPAAYAAEIKDVFTRLRSQMGMPQMRVGIISSDRSGTPSEDAGFAALRQAQALVPGIDPLTSLIMPYQDFSGQGLLGDNVHLTQPAYNTEGAIAANGMADALGYS